jgi:hypothetical protein
VASNGHIYFTSFDDGTMTVLKIGSDKPEVAQFGEFSADQSRIA